MKEKKEKSIQEKMYDQSRITNVFLLIIIIILLFLYFKPCCQNQLSCPVNSLSKPETKPIVIDKISKKKIES